MDDQAGVRLGGDVVKRSIKGHCHHIEYNGGGLE